MFTEREYSQFVLKTVEAIIEALGGSSAAAELAGVGMSAVSNWKSRGTIPAELFVVFSRVLERHGNRADPSLFGMVGASS